MYTEAIAFIVLFACVSSCGSGTEAVGSSGRRAVTGRVLAGAVVRRTDGWKYHVTACDGLRRELRPAPLRTAARPHRRTAADAPATSVSIRPMPAGNLSFAARTPGRLSTRNAIAHASWKLENMKRLRERNPSVMPAG